MKEAFVSCAEVLFDDLPNKCTLISRIKDISVSPRTVETYHGYGYRCS